MKRIVSLLAALALLLSGCAGAGMGPKQEKFTATFLDVFDTVTTIVGMAPDEATFEQAARAVHEQLKQYHQLFDIYNTYDGMTNLKSVNDKAGIEPVQVDGRILRLLQDCKSYYTATNGRVNVTMGSVLALWHEKRSQAMDDPRVAALPDAAALAEAAKHCDIDQLILDEAASTVYLADPQMRLDVGAVAKGWAVEQVSKTAAKGLLISVGGNVRATGSKDEAGTPWVVGVQDPNGGDKYLHTVYVPDGSVVTSGDYQRLYVVDGKPYHHIIDPDTLYPSEYWRSVTIICPDSGAADALSTALFLLSLEEGQQLLEQFGAEALWVDRDGKLHYSPGFQKMIRT
jgi:thiamine biosynthesis lipoprotein